MVDKIHGRQLTWSIENMVDKDYVYNVIRSTEIVIDKEHGRHNYMVDKE